MKLFWKLFFCIISVTAVAFCVSGHILVYTSFHSALDKESKRIAGVNAAFASSFEIAAEKMYNRKMLEEEEAVGLVLSISFSEMSDMIQLVIRDQEENVLYQKAKQFPIPDTALKDRAKEELVAYTIKEETGQYYLHAASVISVGKWNYYVESISEISSVFEQKKDQYRIYRNCMCGLIAAVSGVILFLAVWITRPIRKLSQAAQDIGNGDYTKRIPVYGTDEVNELAKKFNWMMEKLEQNMMDLKEYAKRQEEFVGSFSHEMKTPLTSIIGYSDMLRSRQMTEEERMLYSDYILRQGKRLEKLSARMLELIVMGKKDIRMQRINLKNFLEMMQEELSPVLRERRIVLEVKVDEIYLMAEPVLLKSVFLNLIDNSKNAVEENGTIGIEAKKEPGLIRISVWDNGKGISPKDIKRVTESFYMADKSRKYENEGVGLGLSICKKVLEFHGADMEIESTEGKGTRITISFKE